MLSHKRKKIAGIKLISERNTSALHQYNRIDNNVDMEKDKNLYIGYRWIEDSMKRIITLPLGLKFMMPDSKKYDLTMLSDGMEIIRFGAHSRIVKDENGQHWYHRETRIGELEAFDTYEPLPDYIVSGEYESKRVPEMMIYPYLRLDFARGMLEIFENCNFSRRDEEYRREFLEMNDSQF